MVRCGAVLVTVALGLAACGDDGSATEPDQTTTTTTTGDAAADPLAGTWTTAPVTCDQQQAAIEQAGFTPEQQTLGEWKCFPEVVTLRFEDGRLVVFEDDEIGWEGDYEVSEDGTFTAGGDTEDDGLYISYAYELDGDELVIDMLSDDYATTSEAERLGEQMAQTRIFDSVPFVRA